MSLPRLTEAFGFGKKSNSADKLTEGEISWLYSLVMHAGKEWENDVEFEQYGINHKNIMRKLSMMLPEQFP
jgi:hypothetical protein